MIAPLPPLELARRILRLVVAGCIASTLAACSDPGSSAPRAWRDLSAQVDPQVGLTVPLAPVALETHADYDDFERSLGGRVARTIIIDIYRELAVDADPATAPGVRLLVRLALQLLAPGAGNDQAGVIAIAERLGTTKTTSLDVVWLHVQMLRNALSRQPEMLRPDRPETVRVQMEELKSRLARLIEGLDAWGPPAEVTSERLQSDMDTLAQLLTPGEVPPAAAGAEPGPAVVDSDKVLSARRALWRLERAHSIDRGTQCADRREAGETGGASQLERLVDLRCAVIEGATKRALQLVKSLHGSIALGDPCTWLRRAAQAAELDADRLAELTAAEDLPACPATP